MCEGVMPAIPSPIKYEHNFENAEPLSDANFRRLTEYIHSHCGIKVTPKKKTMIDGRLRRRMRSLNIDNINDYCIFLFENTSLEAEAEIVHFIDAVTTNKTDFFREPVHFEYMLNHALPKLIDAGSRAIKVWSAASSTGAEAYTIAMVLDLFISSFGHMDYSVLGTDICTDVLNKGVAAVYPDIMIDPIPEEYRHRYVLLPIDRNRHEFRIARCLRNKVGFTHLNLMDDRYPFDRDFDIIFLRNILIYFDKPAQNSVLAKLCDHIRPGGYLFLGHSETISGIKLPLDAVANTIFRRR
jgi:chemotaxis protein methyltransferase CheR